MQQSYHFCLHFCRSRLQSAQLRLQSRRGRQEQGKSAVRRMDRPHPERHKSKSIPNTPSVVSPYSIGCLPFLLVLDNSNFILSYYRLTLGARSFIMISFPGLTGKSSSAVFTIRENRMVPAHLGPP